MPWIPRLQRKTGKQRACCFKLHLCNIQHPEQVKASPGAVCSTCDERVDQEFVTVACSNMEGSVAVLVDAVNLSTWSKMDVFEDHVLL